MRSRQREVAFPNGWGGKRKGAGRPRRRSKASHLRRPAHKRWQPIHVTLRARRLLPSLRRQSLYAELRRTFSPYSPVLVSRYTLLGARRPRAPHRRGRRPGVARPRHGWVGHSDRACGESGAPPKRPSVVLSLSCAGAHYTTRSAQRYRLRSFQPQQAYARGAWIRRMLVGAVAEGMGNATHGPAVRRVQEPAGARPRDLARSHRVEAPRVDSPR